MYTVSITGSSLVQPHTRFPDVGFITNKAYNEKGKDNKSRLSVFKVPITTNKNTKKYFSGIYLVPMVISYKDRRDGHSYEFFFYLDVSFMDADKYFQENSYDIYTLYELLEKEMNSPTNMIKIQNDLKNLVIANTAENLGSSNLDKDENRLMTFPTAKIYDCKIEVIRTVNGFNGVLSDNNIVSHVVECGKRIYVIDGRENRNYAGELYMFKGEDLSYINSTDHPDNNNLHDDDFKFACLFYADNEFESLNCDYDDCECLIENNEKLTTSKKNGYIGNVTYLEFNKHRFMRQVSFNYIIKAMVGDK